MTYAPPARQMVECAPRLKTLAIEGWRGINHSIALVNQLQILELLKIDGLKLFHNDLPYAFPHWSRATNGSGLRPEQQAAIDAITIPGDDPVDCIYRIGSPFTAGPERERCKTVTFMVTEFGLTATNFASAADSSFFTRDDNIIVTPSNWSRERLVDWGFPAAKVEVIPHGVDGSTFAPLGPQDRRERRSALGLSEDETVFLNVGLSTWNKGIDLLLIAFATLRAAGRKVRLILKDQRDLYGRSVEALIKSVGAECPALLATDTLSAISVIATNLGTEDLRTLFAVADCYVSPYRAEGFNLPVLEAIACGTPVIATRGGATDDFCNDDVALRIRGTAASLALEPAGTTGRYIEPDLREMVQAMEAFTERTGGGLEQFGAGRSAVLERFTWKAVARKLAQITVGHIPASHDPRTCATNTPTKSIAHVIDQTAVLSFIDNIMPHAMSRTGKVRIGNNYDGGYVLPAIALDCDALMSIGVGPDVSFDLDLAVRGVKVAQFDHTVAGAPTTHENFTFYGMGWGARSEGQLLAFDDIMTRFALLEPRRCILKFDIEGSEYDVLKSIDAQALLLFDIIVCEFHDFGRLSESEFHDTARQCIEKLTTFHAIVHLHANNYGGMSLVHGVAVPNVVELSFLRRDLDSFTSEYPATIPGPLDRPNHPGLPDIHLSAFTCR